jgi:hypothetical protein
MNSDSPADPAVPAKLNVRLAPKRHGKCATLATLKNPRAKFYK